VNSEGFADHSRELNPFSARGALRRAVIETDWFRLRATGAVERALATPRVHFIYSHHMFPDEVGNFRRTVEQLVRTHDVVTYSRAVELVYSGKVTRPTACFSFDDGLKTTVAASRLLDEFGIKACFFICSAIVGEKDPALVKRFCLTRLHYPAMEILSWEDVEDMLKRGHEIGSHTRTHPDLGDISVEQTIDEVEYSRDDLTKRLGTVRHFAWPTGKWTTFSPYAGKAVFDAGYESCASATRGCHLPRPNALERREVCLRRDHIMGAWPVHHNLYFVARSAIRAGGNDCGWPRTWQEIIKSDRESVAPPDMTESAGVTAFAHPA
jgi:peptidoglycan/xylan/chitin deacetylase (PgdA/CDA1 family)